MKKVFLLLQILAASLIYAQAPVFVSPARWDSLKVAGALGNGQYVISSTYRSAPVQPVVQPPASQSVPANCNCMMPIDNTFQVVPFNFGTPPDYRNDDGSSPLINIPFVFCFYGNIYTSLYINNNGNVSFSNPYGTFTASGFPTNQVEMIAPFWADVDTQNPLSGIVYYKVTPSAVIVRWQTVGYFAQHADKLNDFQLILTDGFDPLLPAGSNVSFCYGDMQWTTGDASGGNNGFGGTAATVGANAGDGVNFIQIGTFDQPGTTYNGPMGPASQVSWLDYQQFFFNACNVGNGNNIPPIMNAAQVCDTLTLCVGDTLPIAATFLSPETNQITTITVTASGTGYTQVSNTPGSTAVLAGIFVGMQSNIGYNTILVSGADNGVPVQTTSGTVVVEVVPGPTAQFTATSACPDSLISFNSLGTVIIPGNGPIVNWHWEFNNPTVTNGSDTSALQLPQYAYNAGGTYTVNLTVTDSLGCSDTVNGSITVFHQPQVLFSGTPLSGCAPLCTDFTDQSTVTNSTINSWLWTFGDGGTANTANPQHCYTVNGSYTAGLTVTSADGCENSDSLPGYVNVIPGPVANIWASPLASSINNPVIYFTDSSTGAPATWLWDFGGGSFSTDQNTSFTFSDTGTYCVTLIVGGPGGVCPDTATECITILPELLIWYPNAFTPNGSGLNDVFKPVVSDPGYIAGYMLFVFDRWGNMVFNTTDLATGWDGRMQTTGEKCQIDTYVYLVSITDKDGHIFDHRGVVNLIR
jgi:gliding motility-associated-like protein